MDSGIIGYVPQVEAPVAGSNITASWERCARAGLDPDRRAPPPVVDGAAFRAHLEQRGQLVELFQFFVKRHAALLDQVGACSLVCDDSGTVLARAGRPEILSRFDRASIHEGLDCSEAALGTNAPGLALVTREPVVVTADEHFSRRYRNAFCVASPILDGERGLLGCIDVTKLLGRNVSAEVSRRLLDVAISVSDAIRGELSLRKRERPASTGGWTGWSPQPPAPPPREERPARAVLAPLDATSSRFGDIVGRSPRLAEVVRLARSFSRKDANVLLQGETGTGKELVARAIHNEGPRASGRFVAVNCAAIPIELAESELFGYERGAFTGARAEGQPGKFELAHGGTLFLDEVDSMPLEVQAKILRAVETKRTARLHGRREIPVDVRIIAAGNRSLRDEVLAGRFRKDLFYRLNVLRLAIPALREVREDVTLLLDAFLAAFAAELGTGAKVLSEEARARLVAYDWPGNVRELRNCVEYLYHSVDEPIVALHDLPPEIACDPVAEAPPAGGRALDALERRLLQDAMREHRGNAAVVAKALGMSRATVYRKLKKHGIT